MPSPDGRSLIELQDGTLSVRPITGGGWAPLVSGISMNSPVFPTPNGKWVFYQDKDGARKNHLFLAPIAGGKPQHIGDSPDEYYFRDYFFSPGSRQVLAWRDGTVDLWLLENFVPSASK